jgi:hypothetical protein
MNADKFKNDLAAWRTKATATNLKGEVNSTEQNCFPSAFIGGKSQFWIFAIGSI